MSNLPCAIIVAHAAKADAEAVLSAYRDQPQQFGRPLIPVDTVNPSHTTTPTHWLMFDTQTSQENITVYNGFAANNAPPLPNGKQWGVDGVIDVNVGMAAVNAANLQVYSASGDVIPTEFVEGRDDGNGGKVGGLLLSRGLMYRPEEAGLFD